MTKLALLKKVSFNVNDGEILSLNDKVNYSDFLGTLNLFHKINEILGNVMIEVQNCSYDDTHLIQAFFIEDNKCEVHDNIILVKRLINENDSYTYLSETPMNWETFDPYTYCDVTNEDVELILRRKNELKCVIVKTSGEIDNVFCRIKYNDDNKTGTISVKTEKGNKKEFSYLNIPLLCNTENENGKSSDEIDALITKTTDECMTDFFYSQYNFSMGLLNCYSPIFGKEKNETVSKLFGMDFYGDIIINLENNLNEDERLLDMNSELFNKIKNVFNKSDVNFKNKLFCNIYYELN